MAGIWNKVCEIFLSLVQPTRRKTRVTFSPSTLMREIQRNTRLTASTNPFFNFFTELRLKIRDNDINNYCLTPRDLTRLSKTAGRLWNSMTDEEKAPYRKLALEQRKLKGVSRNRKKSRWTKRKNKRRKRLKNLKTMLTGAAPIPNTETALVPVGCRSPEIIGDSVLNNNKGIVARLHR